MGIIASITKAPKENLVCVPRKEITAKDINEARSITIFNHTIDETIMSKNFYRSLKQYPKNSNYTYEINVLIV